MEAEDSQKEEGELIAQPNLQDANTGLFCFLNSDRPCGPDCMAYTTHVKRAASSELNAQSAHCSVLVSLERAGRNLTVIAGDVHHHLVGQGKRTADAAREAQVNATQTPFGIPRK